MTPEQRAELRSIAEGQTKTKRRTLLPSPPPAAGTPAQELKAWLSGVLGLGNDPIADLQRFGRHDDAPVVVTLRSGLRIAYPRQADTFNPDVLVRRVILVTGAEVPPYARADALAIASAFVRAAELRGEDDDRAEARELGRSFLHEATQLAPEDMSTPEGRYGGLRALLGWRHPEPTPWLTVAQRAAVLVDHEGAQYVRVGEFAAHVRGIAGHAVPWKTLHGRMAEVGWDYPSELQQRQPRGTAKVKAHVYRVPAGWDDDEGDEHAVDAALDPCTPVYGHIAHARPACARTRVGAGYTRGRGYKLAGHVG